VQIQTRNALDGRRSTYLHCLCARCFIVSASRRLIGLYVRTW